MKNPFVIGLLGILCSSPSWGAVSSKLSQFPEGERLLYTKLVEAYRHSQVAEALHERQVLERNYPTSVHLDNAYYLTGMLEFQRNDFGSAIKSFDVVTRRLTHSNKRPAALFATAVAYQRLNLKPLAMRVFNQILKEYPGSPESQRAWMELRIAKKG